MNNSENLLFNVLRDENRIQVERYFDAEPSLVWRTWTEPQFLDLWWAPKPYKTETKSMDFRPGGTWLYSMLGPQGDRHWCRADYESIDSGRSYSALDAFCDENGNINTDFSRSHWSNVFSESGSGTLVSITIDYPSAEDLQKIIELGFREGFTMAMENLDEWFKSNK